MRRKGIIEFVCERVERGETGPRDGGEVVVFVVIADLERPYLAGDLRRVEGRTL